ncbi:MAG TPA: LEA type 2 family protein [Polyangiaceae bacterium]|nr:LEA type 2 family protein [Polyangiaceae bacterium]
MQNSFAARWFGCSALAVTLTLSACSKPEPPTVRPRSVTVKSLGPQGLTLSVELDVQNPNSFALSAHSVDGVLQLGDGVELGRAAASPEAPIPAKDSAVVPSELTVNFTNLAALAPLALSEQPVPYRFKGQAQIGSEKLNVGVPFELTGELTRAQLLQLGLRGLGTLPH